MRTNIIVNLQHEAVHQWTDCKLEGVEFLAFPHRHIFHICCKKEVTHDDRDIEIILLKRKVNSFLDEMYPKTFGDMSCEMIAKELLNVFELNYCSVLEDNENGAEVWQ
jgi:hypothetical protein|tara:strand:+ start:2171 stop:2494 length:324 start_codon:yes stop_codon:yes gene_type:complete